MQWWTEFWTWVNENQLAATVIGTLLASGLIWLLTKVPKIGPHVRAAVKWVWSWHPVSARRYQRELDAAKDFAVRASKERSDPLVHAIEDLHKQVQKIDDRTKPNRITIDTSANVRAAVAGNGEASNGEVPKPSRALAPRWRLEYLDGDKLHDHTYKLSNLVPDSVARRVRVDNVYGAPKAFDFKDAAAWADLSGKVEVTFIGEIMQVNDYNIFRLKLVWFDERDKYHDVEFSLRGPKEWDPPAEDDPGEPAEDTSF